MNTPQQPLALQDFQKLITPEYIRILQVIHGALAMGPVVFLVAVISTYSNALKQPAPDEVESVMWMSAVHVLFASIVYPLAQYLFDVRFRKEKREQFLEQANAMLSPGLHSGAEKYLSMLRTAMIIRLALIEGVAFFGLTICVVAATDGLLREQPVYWLNSLSSLVMIGFVLVNFPTREHIELFCQERIIQQQ